MAKQYYIGIMSGTSMDGADAVLVQMDSMRWCGVHAHTFEAYPNDLKQRLLDLQNSGEHELHRSRVLARELALLYARVAEKLLCENGLHPQQIRALGCHGQTVRHAPEHGYSVQLADWALVAQLSGIDTVGDLRSADLAAGGQGAPLVPAFHHALFAAERTCVLLNIGGIANISIIAPDAAPFGFDTGAGNMLADAWTQHIWGEPYDRNGEKAKQGKLLPELLHALCAHPYFEQPAPKSTGRELFSLTWLQSHLHGNENPFDVLHTLLHFTAQTVTDAVCRYAPDAEAVYACGGGVENSELMRLLAAALSARGIALQRTDVLQLPPQQMEAAAFAWLAACHCQGVAIDLTRATGARVPALLGAMYPVVKKVEVPMSEPSQTPEQAVSEFKSSGGIARIAGAWQYSKDGLAAAFRHEAAFRQLLALHSVLFVAVWCFDFDTPVRMLLIAASFVSLAVELLNTAIEAVVDYISLEKHPLAKRAKDAGSAAQLLATTMVALLWLMAWWA